MTRKHLSLLARLIGELRGELSPVRFEQLLCDASALCAEVNPAFGERRFREEAARHFVKQGSMEVKG